MKHLIAISFILLNIPLLYSQGDTLQLNQDAIYNRPFISIGETRTAVGGYLEGNTNYLVTDGIAEGFSMEMRRFNIFLYSRIHPKIKFLSELEFEHGTEEIALETALIDFEIDPAFNLRGGVILPAIGLVNTNHDSPNWEFIERPLSSTELIPTTLSEIGFGMFGKFYPSTNTVISYDLYMVNGLSENIILNSKGKTYIPLGKSGNILGEDNNGSPMMNGRVSYSNRKIGELGLAWYGGYYNRFRLDGEQVEKKRLLSLFSADYQFNIRKIAVKGEFVNAGIDVPEAIDEIYGTKQMGGFTDVIFPLLTTDLLGFDNLKINLAGRFEWMDFNRGTFRTNIEGDIGDEIIGWRVGLGLRPSPGTIIRLNYSYQYFEDILKNPRVRSAGIQFGFASYF